MLVVGRQRLKTISKEPTPAPTKSHRGDRMAVVCKLECMGNLTAVEKKKYVELEYRHGLLGRVGNQTLWRRVFAPPPPSAEPRDFGCTGNGHRLPLQTPAQVHARAAPAPRA